MQKFRSRYAWSVRRGAAFSRVNRVRNGPHERASHPFSRQRAMVEIRFVRLLFRHEGGKHFARLENEIVAYDKAGGTEAGCESNAIVPSAPFLFTDEQKK